ncbi:hypothetical protein M441DRAFT_368267 [Trichoderma asperellum CBS 433.97]|uniref:Uncharacterized protein n=1 Tax=Trichoderma asperellum (strain ATCC 204424 / CBS 433.97 / NBRC 101777) TaxID=1042311 RepID=A0A2T3ZEI7_TRIA4|nr:hypothetical protein M441DRAFT_368267 [Trichoderma asperellum CBS 433.97]PTB43232.1 hypothetical protein M441DRAFT_368267 [Trichoderma asperellum CBS 433.97]
MNRLFMLEKKNRNQNLREARCQIIRFLLMSNVITFFVSLPLLLSYLSPLSSLLPRFFFFVSFNVSITRLLCLLDFLTRFNKYLLSLSLFLFTPLRTKAGGCCSLSDFLCFVSFFSSLIGLVL